VAEDRLTVALKVLAYRTRFTLFILSWCGLQIAKLKGDGPECSSVFVWSEGMRDPRRFGRSLGERMVIRMRNNIDAQQALRRMASEVAGRANTMVLAEGKQREDVARWVGVVQAACAQRVAEHLTRGSEIEPSGTS
jgi:hypothetical protein